ncbi:cell division protein FtsA [Candidatus Woesebacteria bacterium]|nr:cell division protein FtsA [Candidatus Woesebacteria bacterium]MCD8506792.1 cell division protein FtsA [Candidatus Woesebacteria bacterium]MCD8527701.1 cell division protein FtsA [Candidatus Woesebacteria bacterium]MCD8546330.1 cell division protein FtsA [Candidatus Woesebacteria bacterium]
MSKNTVIAAIDIGTAKVCTLIAIVEEGGELRVVGASSVQSQGIRKSQIVNLEEATSAITESVDAAERMAGFSITQAYVSVSGKHIESQNSKGVVAVADPQGDIVHEDVDRVIEAARAVSLPSNREILHVVPTSFKVDSQEGIKDPIGMSGVRLEAETHIITGSTTVMKNIRKSVESLGIQVADFIFSGLASAYSVLNETEQELGVAVIDIGAGSSAMSVFVEGSLMYSTVIPVGALHITKDIALGSRVSIPSAERIKIALSHMPPESPSRLPDESREEARKRKKQEDQLDLHQLGLVDETRYLSRTTLTDGIIAPRLREIFDLIDDEISKQKLKNDIPAGLILTGGGADTAGILDVAKKTINLPARVGKPAGLRGLIDEIETPMYATATGLLLYAQQTGNWQAHKESSFALGNLTPKLNAEGITEGIKKLVKLFMP